MLIKNTHVVPACAPSAAKETAFILEAEFLLHGKVGADSTLCNKRLCLEMWRLYLKDLCFDLFWVFFFFYPNIPLPGSYDSLIPGK